MGFLDRIKKVVSSTDQPGYAAWIPDDHVAPPPQQAPPRFAAEATYLRWFLAEARLSHTRKWFTEWHPAIHAAVARSYGNKVDERVTVVSPGSIAGFDQTAAAAVTFNKPLTPLLPFPGGLVSVNVGLVAVQGDNSVRTLIDVLGSFGGLVTSVPLTTGLDVAGKVVDGFEKLLGIGPKNLVLAYDGTLSLSGGGAARDLAPGYLAVYDEPIPAGYALWVRDGHLLAWPGGQAASVVPQGNYLLLRLESRTDRDEWRHLDDIEEPLLAARRATDSAIRRVNYDRAVQAARLSHDLHEADQIRIALTLREMRDQDVGLGAVAGGPEDLAAVAAAATLSVDDALEQRPSLGELLA